MMNSEMLKKYDMLTLEEYKTMFGDTVETESIFYQTLLKQTDYITLKIFEGSMTSTDCIEELEAREYSRMKLAELNSEEYIPKASKNIEERTTEAETISATMLGTETNKDQASEQFRKAVQMFCQTLSDDEAMEIATVYPVYIVGKVYKADEMFTYGTNEVGDPQLYRVVSEHTSQADWTPDATPALYTPIGLTEEGYPVWSRPTGSHDAYGIGDIVDYNGTLYKSLIDGNVYSPEEYPAGWEVYATE